jgi:hypothetical protein
MQVSPENNSSIQLCKSSGTAFKKRFLTLLIGLQAISSMQQRCPCASFLNWERRHKGVLGSGGIAPRILDLGTRWRWMVSFTPRPLYSQGNSSWCPLDRGLGGFQSRSRGGGEEKNFQPLPGLEPPIIQPVAQRYTTELCRLLLPYGRPERRLEVNIKMNRKLWVK